MYTRTATASDLPDIADIASRCFLDDELFSFTNPYRYDFPLDFRNSFLRRLRLRYWTPGIAINVAVLEAGDKTAGGEEARAEGTIVGYALWDRIGEGESVQKWRNKGWAAPIERFLLSLEARYISTLRLDRSLDPDKLAICLKALGEEIDNITSMWRLRNLCTDLLYQRRGVGSMLMAWGKERATEEGVPIGLSSSTEGQGLYLKEGFRRYRTVRIEGFPIEEIPIFLWEPPGLEGQWGSEKDKEILVEEGLVA